MTAQVDFGGGREPAKFKVIIEWTDERRLRQIHLGSDSLQGDAGFYRVLMQMGATGSQTGNSTFIEGTGSIHGADLDLTSMPDMTLTAAVVALFADGPTKIRGVEILRHHESDRLAAGACELRKLGALVTEHEDGLDIVPPGVAGSHGR